MSNYTRYEIVQSGVVDGEGGIFVRRIVLDSNQRPRPVYRTYRGKKLWETRTSQMAHRNDLIIESSWSTGDEPGYSTLALYAVSGPSEVATGGKQLCRIPATEDQKTEVLTNLRNNYPELYDFLLPEVKFPCFDVAQSVLPRFPDWNGVGECERKQIAYIRLLLAPLPEAELDELCTMAMNSPRIAVDPKEKLPIPAETDSYTHDMHLNETSVLGIEPVWYIISQSGFVTVHTGPEVISIPQGSPAVIKVWKNAFLAPDGTHYGMIIKIFER